MHTKHHVLLVGIVLSILLSIICGFLALKTFNKDALQLMGYSLTYLVMSWSVGGLVFYLIKKLFLNSDNNH